MDTFSDEVLAKKMTTTCENLRNSYTSCAHVKKDLPGQRIDYILYHPGSRMHVESKNYRQPLPDRVPKHSYSYSDHEAIESTLVITSKKTSTFSLDNEEKKCVLEDCVGVLTKALSKLGVHQFFYSLFAIVLFALLLLSFVFNSPFGYPIIFNILRVFIVILIVFCFLMAIIWNRIEKHGILATKLAIDVSLRQFSKDL